VTALRQHDGQATVILVISLVVLLGMAALVLDVGSWFQAQRQTQSAADAAALAAAHALPWDSTSAESMADQYLTKNGGGTAEVTISTTHVADDTVRVELTRETPGFFARVLGIDAVDVHAKATALTGDPDQVRWGAPFGVDEQHPMLQCEPDPCFGEETRLELDKIGPGAYRVLNIDGSHGGIGGKILEDWILQGYEGYMPRDWYFSDPGAKFNSSQVRAALDARLGDELLFPVYRSTRSEGANFEYEVIGWVGFVLSDYHIQGSKLSWLDGSFTHLIWEGIQGGSGGGTNFGVNAIQLVE
jgi:hypothetical protein